jgi:hypothetical protein
MAWSTILILLAMQNTMTDLVFTFNCAMLGKTLVRLAQTSTLSKLKFLM